MRTIITGALLGLCAVACSKESDDGGSGGGMAAGGVGTSGSGGANSSTGGANSAGGVSAKGGGTSATGGATGPASGGSSGGSKASGGKASASGGASSGGNNSGGTLQTGGVAANGGMVTANGGKAGSTSSEWLTTKGNRILKGDGMPFHGRGANLFDTRSCDACSFQPPNPTGLKAWADELIDNWKANFIRFNLMSFPESGGRVQWKSLLDDPQYYADIQTVVNHMTSKPGVYVMVTLFVDPSMVPSGQAHATWPTERTLPVYKKLAEAFVNNPRVLFGLMNEPQDPPSENAALAQIFTKAIDTIRTVEAAAGTPQHIIVAQATQTWARELTYWLANPLGLNIAYEIHPYNPPADFDRLLVQPAKTLPVIIGEFGFSEYQTIAQARTLMEVAEMNGVPWLAWSFHQRCDPNLLEDEGGTGYDGCGLTGAGSVYRWPPTEWGKAVKDRLAMPW
jgi:hypothetical protein